VKESDNQEEKEILLSLPSRSYPILTLYFSFGRRSTSKRLGKERKEGGVGELPHAKQRQVVRPAVACYSQLPLNGCFLFFSSFFP